MPRKLTTFAEKVKRERHVNYCPKCGGALEALLYVDCVKSDSGFWKFKERHVHVCKCNHDEFYK
ncbi:MAG: hypothetical protein WCE90_10745 [Candidatus Zixiibacteriota bacterium]